MLRPHVEDHLGAVEQRFLGCGDLYLVHEFTTLWSAVTCHRFGRSRPVATNVSFELQEDMGVKPPKAKAVTGHRTPKLRCDRLRCTRNITTGDTPRLDN